MNLFQPDPVDWPFEAQIDLPNGSREYSQHARKNTDGTVSVISWGPNGPAEQTFAAKYVTLKERPWELAQKWYVLFALLFAELETNDT